MEERNVKTDNHKDTGRFAEWDRPVCRWIPVGWL